MFLMALRNQPLELSRRTKPKRYLFLQLTSSFSRQSSFIDQKSLIKGVTPSVSRSTAAPVDYGRRPSPSNTTASSDNDDEDEVSKIALHVFHNGARYMPKSLMILIDQQPVLANCPESTRRYFDMVGKGTTGLLRHVLATNHSWFAIGGLPELLIDMEHDALVPNNMRPIDGPISLHGVAGVNNTLLCARAAGICPGLELRHVSARHDENQFSIDSFPFRPLRGFRSEGLPCVAYVLRTKRKVGLPNIDVQKCLELGLEIGAEFRKLLTFGQPMKRADGSVIRLTDISKPNVFPAVTIALVECPTFAHLRAMNEHEQLQQNIAKDKRLDVLVHMSPREIVLSHNYQKWVQSVAQPSTVHLMLNEDCPSLPLPGIFTIQNVLNLLHSDAFPLLPNFSNCALGGENKEIVQKNHRKLPDFGCDVDKILFAKPLQSLELWPNENQLSDIDRKADFEQVFDEVKLGPDFERLLTETRSEYEAWKHRFPENKLKETIGLTNGTSTCFPELLFLGTSSALQMPTRNVSAILLTLSENTVLLMDCGSGTFQQLLQFYGEEKIDNVLRRIRMILITHLHSDHHFGLITLLQQRKLAFQRARQRYEPVFLVAASQLCQMYHEYSLTVEHVLNLVYRIPIQAHGDSNYKQLLAEACSKIGCVALIQPVPVIHPMFAYGFVIETKTGKKLVYSGDTRPCPALIEAGQDCDVLIHEASMESDLTERANTTEHSTVAEALSVSQAMRAKRTVLTHFSARYHYGLPIVDTSELMPDVTLAFDFMRVNFDQLEFMPKLLPLLKSALWRMEDQVRAKQIDRAWRSRANEEKDLENKAKEAEQKEEYFFNFDEPIVIPSLDYVETSQ